MTNCLNFRMSILSFLIIFVFWMEGVTDAQEVRVELRTDKKVYVTGEPIWVEIILHNVSQDTFDIRGIKWDKHLFVLDSKDRKLNPTLIITWGSNVMWEPTFLPGDTKKFHRELTSHFGYEAHRVPYFKQGNYRVFFKAIEGGGSKYDNLIERRRYYKPTLLESNEVFFEVVKPNDEDIIVLTLLRKALDYENERLWDKADSMFQIVLRDHPYSPYSVRALNMTALLYKFSPDENEKRLAKDRYEQLVNKYPDSYYAVEALWDVVQYYDTRGEKEMKLRFLEEVAKNHPETKAGREVQKWLNRRPRGQR